MKKKQEQEVIRGYLSQLVQQAQEYAREQMHIQPMDSDFIRALLDHAAAAYSFHVTLAARVQALAVEVEALRRVVQGTHASEERILN